MTDTGDNSIPLNSQKDLMESKDSTRININHDESQRVVIVGGHQVAEYKNNFVKTSKYEWWNFLPKFLLEAFDPRYKIANCYFLMISAFQCIPPISNTNGYPTTLIPLTLVVTIDGIFQALEDFNRHMSDMKANASKTKRYNPSTQHFDEVIWSKLEVGDIIKVESRCNVPADIVILSVSEKYTQPTGMCYVETKSLDGETNLKIRQALPLTYADVQANHTSISSLHGRIDMEKPNKLIDSFSGVIELSNRGRIAIQPQNVILRGCVVRNTEWVLAIVVNTGHDTKIMMSSKQTKLKVSQLESQASYQIRYVILLLFCISLIGAIGHTIWNSVNDIKHIWYLNSHINQGTDFIIMFFYYMLLHATFIPVSLYVSMSIARYGQRFFMMQDLDMYEATLDTPADVRTMTLNEELGQITHVLTDKTGTLTCNIMDFRKMSINGVKYGKGITEIGKAAWKLRGQDIPVDILDEEQKSQDYAVPHVAFYCPQYKYDLEHDLEQAEKCYEFFRILSICHEVIPEMVDGKTSYSAPNPDDQALVSAAKYFGYSFIDRIEKTVVIEDKRHLTTINSEPLDDTISTHSHSHSDIIHSPVIKNTVTTLPTVKLTLSNNSPTKPKKLLEMEILDTISFTSKRKRMSVIVRQPDQTIVLYSKGADTAMLPRLAPHQDGILKSTDIHTVEFAEEGLRTLYLTKSLLSEARYMDWKARYNAALTNIVEIEKKKKGIDNLIENLEDEIENNMILIGATAIEDRIQAGVSECMATVLDAGIKVWVLTGDKEGTAINVALACSILQPPEFTDHIIINKSICPTNQDMIRVLDEALKNHHLSGLDDSRKMSHVIATSEESHIPPSSKPCSLIIDGPALIQVMMTESSSDNTLYQKFLTFSQICKAIVCCRMSPDQKRLIVRMVKKDISKSRTLAIGDGANDVAMIQEAHIGVGIKGEEGVQAVNASDYAIAQFRFLSPLLLKHGRYNYIRMSTLICYMFYKNIMMSMGQYFFNFNNAWSGQKYYYELAIQFFNLFFTSIPILILSIFDRDVTPASVYQYPWLYKATAACQYFNSRVFASWIFIAILEAVVSSVLPMYLIFQYEEGYGNTPSFWEMGVLTYTIVVFTLNLKIFVIQYQHNILTVIAVLGSMIIWIAVAYVISRMINFSFDYDTFYTFHHLIQSSSFWLALALLIVIINGRDIFMSAMTRYLNYTPYHIISEMNAGLSSSVKDPNSFENQLCDLWNSSFSNLTTTNTTTTTIRNPRHGTTNIVGGGGGVGLPPPKDDVESHVFSTAERNNSSSHPGSDKIQKHHKMIKLSA